MIPERGRLAAALLLSLLVHALVLSLAFGVEGLGLPGLALPWRERRVEVPDLQVVLVEAAAPAAAPPPAPAVPSRVDRASQARTDGAAPAAPSRAETAPVDATLPADASVAPPQAQPGSTSTQSVATAEVHAMQARALPPALPRAETIGDTAPGASPEPPLIALDDVEAPVMVVPPMPPVPAPVAAPASPASAPQAVLSTTAHARPAMLRHHALARSEPAVEHTMLERALRQFEQEKRQLTDMQDEGARLQARREEATPQEAARQEAARQEAARQEAARQEAARQEAARQEAARQEAARQEAARQEAARQEAARQEAARQETARQETARQEAARQEAALQEAARQEAAGQEAARQQAARAKAADDERREAVRRAMGRQLDEEAARREVATADPQRPGTRREPSSSTRRRGRLFGHTDADAELILYAQAWARKIQLNRTFDLVREAARPPHADPLVTVAIRSDGFVESVTFVISSGVAELDDAIRRVVHSQEPYQAFPPALASEYDVVEIRRTWYFDMAVRLH